MSSGRRSKQILHPGQAKETMFRRQYKLQAKEKQELGVYGRSLPTKPESKWKVDANFVDENGRTHLHHGVLKYCVDDALFESALKVGCDVNSVDNNKRSPLHYAAEKGLVTCVDKLLKRGALPAVLDGEGLSPLMMASRHGHPAVVKSLIKMKGEVNLVNSKGELALHFSCSNSHLECTEVLLKHKAKVNYPDNEGNTPLIQACKSGNTEVVKALVEAGARVDKKDSLKRTSLHWAVLVSNIDIVDIIVRADASLDILDSHFSTPFMYALLTNKADVLKLLLDAGCDRSTIDGLNGTAMSLAALKGYHSCIKVLLEVGEDPDEFSYFGMTALMAAVYECHYDVTSTLLEAGAGVNVVSRMGFTALFAALCHIKPDNVDMRQKLAVLLLQHGANVNFRIGSAAVYTAITDGKNCPMSFAITSGYTSLVHIFLQAGSDIRCSEIKELLSNENTGSFYDLNPILDPIKQYKRNPLPLRQSCRLCIRKRIGSNSPFQKIQALPIAPGLKEYLNFKDLYNGTPERAPLKDKLSEAMTTFVDVKACGLHSLKGSFLYEMIEGPITQSQAGRPCDCDVCKRIGTMAMDM